MNKKPLVSIIMNCLNGEEFLNHAVQSILNQTYKNWELIFWDNKSTDKSAKISGSGFDVLRRADRHFNESEFIQGATAAFNIILTAFAEGDQAQLKRLLSYELLQSFMQTIHDRTAAKETLEITVNDIREVSVLNVELADSVASITVHFYTTQTRIARDEHGNIMDGSDTEPREFIDIWTFERDLTLADPNWKLAETESADDDS